MAETSTTTLLQAVNRVLENLGERRVLNTSSPVARKAVEALKDALTELNSMNDWQFTKDYITASAWNLEKADLGDVLRVHNIQYGSRDLGYRNIAFENLESFDYKPMVAGVASSWATETYNIVKLNPYPNTPEEQAKYRFYVTRDMVFPSVDNSTFPLPERLMMMLYLRAQSILALTHLDDQNAFRAFAQQYEVFLQNVRNRETSTPTYGTNLFKQRGIGRRRY